MKKTIVAILFLTFLVTGIELFITKSEVEAYSVDNLNVNHSDDLTVIPDSLVNQNEYHSSNSVSTIDSEVAKIKESFLKEFQYQIKTRGNIDKEDANELLTIIIEGKTFELKERIEDLEKDVRFLIIKDKFTFTQKSQKRIDDKIIKSLNELNKMQKEFAITQSLQEAKRKRNPRKQYEKNK